MLLHAGYVTESYVLFSSDTLDAICISTAVVKGCSRISVLTLLNPFSVSVLTLFTGSSYLFDFLTILFTSLKSPFYLVLFLLF